MKALSSALVVIAGVYGFLNAHRSVAGPDPLGSITYVICGVVLVFGVGGWMYSLKCDD
jgi:formate hydrogenlyase subunit 3/multisubunit Na+/H+ antiporter MnhD subunit